MMCVRRLAGARRPTLRQGSPHKPDSRHLFRLLPALALLLGVLSSFVAGPALAQTIWSATLTVKDTFPAAPGLFLGCDSSQSDASVHCDSSGALLSRENSFTYEGETNSIVAIAYSDSGLVVTFDRTVPNIHRTWLALQVDGQVCHLGYHELIESGGQEDSQLLCDGVSIDNWFVGAQFQLSIVNAPSLSITGVAGNRVTEGESLIITGTLVEAMPARTPYLAYTEASPDVQVESVGYTAQGSRGTGRNDYAGYIRPGADTFQVRVHAVDDSIAEPLETVPIIVKVDLDRDDTYETERSIRIVVEDNDGEPLVMTSSSTTVREGATGYVTVTLTADPAALPAAGLQVRVTAFGTARREDYEMSPSQVEHYLDDTGQNRSLRAAHFHFTPDDSEHTLRLRARGNDGPEETETIILIAEDVNGLVSLAMLTLTIPGDNSGGGGTGGTPPDNSDPGGDPRGDPGGVPPGDSGPDGTPPGDSGTGGPGLSAPQTAVRNFRENIGDVLASQAMNIGAPVAATGAAPGDQLQYTLEGADREAFTIDAHTGQLRTRPEVLYDYEQRTGYAVVVRASTATASVTTEVAVTLIDVSEVPLAPQAPQVRPVSHDETALAIVWAAPPNAGRPAITGYGVRHRAGSGAWQAGPAPLGSTRTQLARLAPDTRYQVQVRAMNADGYGPWSEVGRGYLGMAVDAPEVEAWLIRFGRTVSDQVLEAAGDRFTATQTGFTARLAGLDLKALRIREAAWQDDLTGVPGAGRSLTWAEAVRGTSFSYTATTGAGEQASLWGRGALTRFDGEDGALRLDGEAVTGLLGSDFVRGSLRAGLILSHSDGDGEYRSPTGAGDLDADLTGLYPWVHRVLGERLSAWALAGYGKGETRLKPDGGMTLKADTDLKMAAAGLRGVLQPGETGSRPELTLSSDGLYVRTESDAAGQVLAGTSARLTRLRLALEGTWHVPLASGAHLRPSVQAGVRHDGGDAESGFGADLATGVAWTDLQRGLTASMRARGLLTHEDSGFQERGLAASLAWDPHPASAVGWSMTLHQALGAPSTGGLDALLRPEAARLPASNDERENARQRRRLEATLGYGVLHARGQLVGTPRATLALSDAAREVRLGWHLGLARKDALRFGLELQGTRQEPLDDDRSPEHRLQLQLGAHW